MTMGVSKGDFNILNYKKHKMILFFVLFLIYVLVVIMSVIKIKSDDSIEIRLLYKYFDIIDSNVNMYVDSGNCISVVQPHMPYFDTKSGGWIDAIYYLDDSSNLENIKIELLEQNTGESSLISMEIYRHGLQVAKYTSEDFLWLFNSNVEDIVVDSIGINYYSNDENLIVLNSNPIFIDEVLKYSASDKDALINIFIIETLLFAILFVLCELYVKNIKKKYPIMNWYDIGFFLVLLVLFCGSCFIAFGSLNHAHCDEEVTRHAIDYYLRAWQKPTKSNHWIWGTASYKYGNHFRVLEDTLYYFFAGKVGWIAREFLGIKMYYRVFGILLLFILLSILWNERRDNPSLCIPIFLTAQSSYIFSYATSDCLDFFFGFLILLLVLKRGSILYKCLDDTFDRKKRIIFGTFVSITFSMMFLAKTNYMIVLFIPFLELFFGWAGKGYKIDILKKYISILVGTLLFSLIFVNLPCDSGCETELSKAKSFDNSVEYSKVVIDDTPWQRGESQLAPQKKGVSFKTFLFDYSYQATPIILWASAFGAFYWSSITVTTKYIYFISFFIFCIGILFFMKALKKKDKHLVLRFILSATGILIGFVISIMYCYFRTFQPQGRYILPLFLLFSYMLYLCEEILKTKAGKIGLLIIGGFSATLYVYYAIDVAYQNGLFLI